MIENIIHFIFAVLALLIIPGPDMALVLANGVAYGKRGAFYSAMGISCGGFILALITALFVGVAFTVNSQLLKVIQLIGAIYIFYLAVITIKDKSTGGNDSSVEPTKGNLFIRGMVTNLSNPKALVFFIAFIPQFIPDNVYYPPVVAFSLGALLCLIGGIVNFSIGAAGSFLSFFNSVGFISRTWGQWIVFLVFISISSAFAFDIVRNW